MKVQIFQVTEKNSDGKYYLYGIDRGISYMKLFRSHRKLLAISSIRIPDILYITLIKM